MLPCVGLFSHLFITHNLSVIGFYFYKIFYRLQFFTLASLIGGVRVECYEFERLLQYNSSKYSLFTNSTRKPHVLQNLNLNGKVKMGKEKKEKKSMDESQNNGTDAEEMSYEDRLKYVSIISKPMAPKKLTKKV